MKNQVKIIISQLKKYKPQKIILFGSWAHGVPGPDSDIDLLVVKNTSKSPRERNIEARLLLKTQTPVDIFVLTPREFEEYSTSNPFIQEIVERGKVVYGQGSINALAG